MASFRLLKNGMKVLLGAGAMYVTVNEGVWSTSESGLYAAQRLRTYVLPETTQYWDKMPSAWNMCSGVVSTWNYGVEKSFNAVANLPETICYYSGQVSRKIWQKVS